MPTQQIDKNFLNWAIRDGENPDSQCAGGCGAKSAETWKAKMATLRRETVQKPTIFIGMGTCGFGAGSHFTLAEIKKYLSEKGIDADIVEVGCIGLCVMEPLVDVQLPGRTRLMFQTVTKDKVTALLDAVFAGEVPKDLVMGQFRTSGQQSWDGVKFQDEHPFFGPQTRWVLKNCGVIDPAQLEEYLASGGYQGLRKILGTDGKPAWDPMEVCVEVEKSGLRGRGGGGFPTGVKWKFARNNKDTHRYLVCNADEGDPGAFMDRAVIEGDPHRLLEGMAIAAYAIGAGKAYIYIRAEYPLAIARLEQAIADAKANNLLGEKILGSDFSLEMVIKKGAGAFVCGEETALIHSIEGKRGMPRPRPPFPAVSGLFGHPTIINNVETLANVPSLIKNGADWFASVGTAGSKGTKVFALSGKVSRTGLVEVAMGTTLREVVFSIGGGIARGKAYKAVQIGGPSGGCIPESHLDIEIDYESLKTVGAMMGSGGLVVMDEDNCMVDVAKFFMDFIQRESCGKCIPCREGTRRMLETLNRITRGRRHETGKQTLERFQSIVYLEHLAEVIRDTSLCGLGQTAPNPVLSTLRWFRHEYEAHVYDRICPAKACVDMIQYQITEKCTGCTLCARKCPADAIVGTAKNTHHIITDKCISCGACADSCRFHAIEKV
ncbi:MAG: NADH-quinone oxidoreductase subunit NuoF [Planctomycetaceae bacterium]|jgi:NADH:ubiquinone oxidoreductase subunit F (NADH-binding)/Pyruvate/2-oxoacid:ferredoxin oxidoreductase delta subunit/(2Fe-2S) ferredoxin|nr:NADH-quinone oxidoreductase subunit NuoF [Planctomycetaceae bacterium]